MVDYVVTEAGFGADLGAEKFVDIKCRKSGLRPDAAVVVATVRALKYHGGVAVADVGTEDLAAVERGMANLSRHLDNIRNSYGVPCVVAINRFPTDTDAEVARMVELVGAEGVMAFPATHFADGGAGAEELAKGVLELLEEPSPYQFSLTYPDELPLLEKMETVAKRLYGASAVTWDAKARKRLDRIEADGYGHLPICVAKTQYSFSTDVDPAGRAHRTHGQRPRGASLGRGRVRRAGVRRHHDDARPPAGPRSRADRHRRERGGRRPVVRVSGRRAWPGARPAHTASTGTDQDAPSAGS